MSAATSSRSCATWSRSRSRRRASASARTWRRARSRPPRSAWSMRWSARPRAPPPRNRSAASCAPASSTTRKSRSRCRPSGGGMPMFEIPGMPGAQMGAISIGDIFGKMGGGRTKTRRLTVQEAHEPLIDEESDKLLDQEQLVQESIKAVEQNGIVFLDEIDKIAGARRPHRRRRVARGRAARSPAADRRHDGLDQARRGEDRPHPVHRVGRVPRLEAVRPAARTAGPAADPRRAAARSRATISAAS